MLGVIREFAQKFVNLFRPIRVNSLNTFILFLRQFKCTSVTVELSAKSGEDKFHCIISFSARFPNGRNVIYRKKFEESRRMGGITLDLRNCQARGILCERLSSDAKTEFAKIRKEIPGVEGAIVDLDGDTLTMDKDGKWSWPEPSWRKA